MAPNLLHSENIQEFIRADKADPSTVWAPIVSSLILLIDRTTILSDEYISVDLRLFWLARHGLLNM
jgi:hypothetical protein